ncbi:MAG: VWA domain-containing protein [Bacteroidota bacterium]|nr:VWA domain-containing protein [Bacteroidota bacterium]MDW8138004.1 VWA domain-containing protein [Bacteroidota bacterium]
MLYTAHALWWGLLWLGLGIGVAYWLYRRTEPELPTWKRAGMAALRAGAITLLGMLLLEPVWSYRHRLILYPQIAWLFDDTQSLDVQSPSGRPAEAARNIARALWSRNWSPIEPVAFRFAEDTARLPHPDSLRFEGRRTNLSRALEAASAQRDRLKALVLVTDGNHNSGPSPLYVAERLGLPVYVVAVGDTMPYRDLRIERVLSGPIAYVGAEMPVSVSVRAEGAPELLQLTVRLERDGRELARQVVPLQPGHSGLAEFRLVPERPGRQLYRVRIDRIGGERTYANNEAAFALEVLERRRRVLVVAGAPSPDLALLRHVLALDPDLQVEARTQKNAAEFYEGPLPERLQDFQALFLVGFPGPVPMEGALERLSRAVREEQLPAVFILSRQSDLRGLEASFGGAFPARLVRPQARQETTVFFEPTGLGLAHPVLELAPEQSGAIWERLPPVSTFEGAFEPRASARVLASMRIRDVRLPDPLVLVQQLGRLRTAALLGWDWWRWKTVGEGTAGIGSAYDALMRNLLSWVSAVRDERLVRVRPAQLGFDPQEPIDFLGHVYNESLEPVSDAELRLSIRGPAGLERRLLLEPRGEGRYEGRTEPLPPGLYRYRAEGRRRGEQIGVDEGEFLVAPLDLERRDIGLNLPLLRQLAARTGGAVFGPEELDSLRALLLSRHGLAQSQERIRRIALWQHPALLALVLLLLTAEWLWRRRNSLP